METQGVHRLASVEVSLIGAGEEIGKTCSEAVISFEIVVVSSRVSTFEVEDISLGEIDDT